MFPVADDDRIALQFVGRQLEEWGYEIVTANDGSEAWRRFQEGRFDIVVTDWMMPGMTGVEIDSV